MLQCLAGASNDFSESLKKTKIIKKEHKYFTINHKYVTDLGKIYLLP